MKFDCIVSNAPFNNGLHEKFESKYFELCKGEIVWISPLSFLLGKKQNKRITLELDKYKTDIEQINGNEYFDAAIGGTMGIVFCDMNNGTDIKFDGKNYSKCEEIRSYSNDELLMSIKTKINCENLLDNIHVHIVKQPNTNKFTSCKIEQNPKDNWWCVRMTPFAGDNHRGNKGADFYTTITKKYINELPITYKDAKSKTYKFNNGMIKNYMDYYIHFNSYSEAKHCLDYLISDFARICIYFIKTTIELSSGELKYVPWQDFTQEWNDEKLFKKYGITKEEIQYIYDILPNYYGIKRINVDSYKLNGITFDGKQYNKCEEITSYSNNEAMKYIINTILKKCNEDCLDKHCKLTEKILPNDGRNRYLENNPNKNWFIIQLPLVRGGKKELDYSSLFTKTMNDKIRTYNEFEQPGKHLMYFAFNTSEEAINFKKYCMSDICRLILYYFKLNISLGKGELKYIPWFNFTDSMFDGTATNVNENIYKYFNFGEKEKTEIRSVISDYYGIW